MVKVYKFNVTLRQLGFVVTKGEDPIRALQEKWAAYGEGLNKADFEADATLVKEFDETDKGLAQAMELEQELEEY